MSVRVCLAVIVMLISLGAAAAPSPKHIAAPPDDIRQGHLRLPDPAAAALRSRSAMLPVRLTAGAPGGAAWETQVPVESGDQVSFALFAPDSARWDLRLQAPGQPAWSLRASPARIGIAHRSGHIMIGDRQIPGEVVSVAAPVAGFWRVRVTAPAARGDGGVDAYLVVGGDSRYRLNSHLLDYRLTTDRPVGLAAYLADGSDNALSGAIRQAALQLRAPDGTAADLELYDDGAHDDGAAADGVYGVRFAAPLVGEYVARVTARGVTPAGEEFQRDTVHVFPVIAPGPRLSGAVSARRIDPQRWRIDLGVEPVAAQAPLRVGAELWGTDSSGTEVPVVWLGGMVVPELQSPGSVLPLYLDARWLQRANARAPYRLRAVRVQDSGTGIPVDVVEKLPVDIDDESPAASAGPVSTDMLMGAWPMFRPVAGSPTSATASVTAAAAGGRVMLVHGYCSSGNPWPLADFTDYAVFSDPNQNRSNDQFAQMLGDAGGAYDSFGVIGHSQGAMAALHLYTYYWSGLDNAVGARRIQSLGAPYRGTALAGSLALLGDIFGAGCGTNWDLSYDGAALWLAGIPGWARSQVYYYTTSFTDKAFRYDYCSLATDLFLDDPDDGVVERAAGQLSGGNNLGHKTGWCHTTGMRDPAAYLDHGRNGIMNANAGR